MSGFILKVLEKMGKWFGIIFKIILPLLFMYRPLKSLAFSFVVLGTYFGSEAQQINALGTVAFCVFYIVFFVLLMFFPKIASATEFVLIGYYFAALAFAYIAGQYNAFFAGMSHIIYEYTKAVPIVILFLSGKIFFFFFVKKNYMSIAQMKFERSHALYNPEDY